MRRKSCTEGTAWRAVSAAETSLLSDLVALGRIHLDAIGDDWPTKISRSIIRPSTFQVVVHGCASEAENTANLGHLARVQWYSASKKPFPWTFLSHFPLPRERYPTVNGGDGAGLEQEQEWLAQK